MQRSSCLTYPSRLIWTEKSCDSVIKVSHHSFEDFLVVLGNVSLSEDCVPNRAVVALDLARLICALSHVLDAKITLILRVCQLFKHWMLLELCDLPVVQVLNISNHVYFASRFQRVRIVRQKSRVDNTSPVV